jgi:predicted TIM-barrel fold metal-dependent hydrolase
MIIDVNGIFGRFGIIAKGAPDVREYLSALDKFEIDISLVCSSMAMLHDTRRGNEMMLGICAEHRDRLKPAAVINPRWGKEEAESFLDRGAAALRLEPSFHRYSLLDDEIMEPVLAVAEGRGIPLIVNAGLCCAQDVYSYMPVRDARSFCEKHPGVQVLLTGAPYEETRGIISFMKKHGSLSLDTAMLYGGRFIEKLVENGLENRVCLGTEYGLQSPAAGMSVIQEAEIPASAKQKMLGLNAKKLFGL